MEQQTKNNFVEVKETLFQNSCAKMNMNDRNKDITGSKKALTRKKILPILLKLYFAINLIISVSSHLNYNSKRQLNMFFSEIKIEIMVKDYNEEINVTHSEFVSCPDEIYLNDIKIAEEECSLIMQNKGNYTFKIIWYNKLTTCQRMFYNLSNIINIDLSKFDSSLVTDMTQMFTYCFSLNSINMENLNTSLVHRMYEMFVVCQSLQFLNLSSFDTSLVTDMSGMFSNCYSLTSLNLSNFNTKLVESMDFMFFLCENLKILNLSNLNTKSVLRMESMFSGCISLISLDISGFDTSKVTDMYRMFSRCESLKSLDLSNFNTSLVDSMFQMFDSCYSLTSLDISSFNTSSCDNMGSMFYNCSSLTSIDASKFDTSLVVSMGYMFYRCEKITSLNLMGFNTKNVRYLANMFDGCSSLISLDLSKFNTTLIEYMDSIFLGCSSLKYLNISNFDTSNVNNMGKMFSGCSSLKSLDLSSFDTSLVTNMESMFENCISLKYINLSNFITWNVNYMNYMFYDCRRLQYINLENFQESGLIDVENMFFNIRDDLIYCASEEKAPVISQFLKEKTNSIKDCSMDWKNKTNSDLINICNASDFFEGKCKINNSNTEEKELIGQKIIEDILDGALDKILANIIENKVSYVIKEDNQIYQISTISYQKENKDKNVTILDLDKCENVLKKENGLDENEELILLKIDNYIPGLKIPIIEYVIFDQKGNFQLNLSYCDNIPILFYTPVSINKNELYKYDSSSIYYKEECNQYTSEYGTDITLYDRKNDYNQNNLSLCEVNCQFKGYNTITLKVECECKIKNKINFFTDINIDKKKLINQLINVKKISNIWVVKCYDLVFSSKGLISNIGSYILIIITLINIASSILFCKKGYNLLYDKMKKIIENRFLFSLDNKNVPPKKKDNNRRTIANNQNNIIIAGNNNIFTESNNEEKEINENDKKENNKEKDDKINIDLNDYEMNSLSYEDAIKYDNRKYWEYYLSLIRTKHLIVFSFYTYNDYNSKIIKICLFFFSLSLFYIINALFFNDSTMHKIYEDHGNFNFVYQLPQILYSTIISIVIKTLLNLLSLTEKTIIEIKNQKTLEMANNKMKDKQKIFITKFIIFFILDFLFLSLFWYYISCFGAVYKNTQLYLIEDTAISFCLSLIYPFFINLIPGLLRIPSLKEKNNACLYIISKIIQLI